MELKNCAPVLFVRDARRARDFYMDVLGCTVTHDFGGLNFFFQEGFALWQILDENIIPQTLGREHIYNAEGVSRFELCFETEDLDADYAALQAVGVRFLHRINTELWGQRTVRFYDPDGHLVEIGEALPVFVRRIYLQEGEDPEAAARRLFMSPEAVKHYLQS
ncbi:MAG: glyoxalase/bleomycin resistance/dioxygenase family protein [Rikenellaceae bacterium]|nr:glyoxalase/bleomycin resistance/dioxygenase family protein [Rikenellaceae bacterium]